MAKEEATLLIKIKESGSAALGNIKDGLVSIAKVAAAAGAAIIGAVGVSIGKFKEQEEAVNRLNQAMVNNGDFTSAASKDLQKFASDLQSVSTFGDETIISMLSLAKSFGVSNEEAKKMIEASANLAAGTGMSLESAVKNLGKTFAGLTGELGESIPALRNLTAEELKSGAAIDLVASKFKGAAAAQAQGLGSLDQMSNAIGDVAETVGKAFAPFVGLAAKQLTIFAQKTQESGGFLSTLGSVAKFVAQTMSVLKNSIMGVGEVIGTGLAAAVESVTLATQLQFSRAKEVAALGMEEVGNVVKERKNILNEELAEIDAVEAEVQAIKQEQDLINTQISLDNKAALLKAAKDKQITEEQMYQAKLLGIETKAGETRQQLEERLNKAKEAARKESLGTIATLQTSSNQTLATIGKAAALTQIAIAAPQGVSKALAAFPPPFNFAAAALVGAAFAAQAAQVAGVQLADGGIVSARPGGIQATIGEGGRDEAVIPLDNSGGFGTTVNITVNGGLLGDESQAREFAVAVDKQLVKLRQNNESLAFDSDLV